MDTTLKHHIVDLESCGPVSIFMQGDEKRLKEGVVFLTVHDVGSTYQSWVTFTKDPSMEDIRRSSVFLHVAVPGQEPRAQDLPKDFTFPTMAQLGVGLVTVLDQLRVKRVIGLGDGAGANIITRFGMMHPSRVHGIVTINNVVTASTGRFLERLKEKMDKKDKEISINEKNVNKFADAYKKRTEILTELNTRIKNDFLLMAGMKSKYVVDTETIHREMVPGLCSMIKVEDVSEPLSESPWKVAEAVLLFCQGMSLLPTVARRMSQSTPSTCQESHRQPKALGEYQSKTITRSFEDDEMPAPSLSF